MAALAGGGGASAGRLDFSAVATRGIPGVAVELKVCEWGCGATFVRQKPITQRLGQKVCVQCLRMQRSERETAAKKQRQFGGER